MLISQAEYARQKGVSRQYVNKLIRQGKLHTDENGKIDLGAADKDFSEIAHPARQSKIAGTDGLASRPAAAPHQEPDGDGGGVSFSRVRTAREAYAAKLAQFEYEQKLGKWIRKDEAVDAMVASGRRMRQMLDAVTEWADELAAGSAGGAAELRRILKTKVRKLEQEMADAISLRGADEDDEQAHDGDRPAH